MSKTDIDEAIKILIDTHDNDLTWIHIEHDDVQREIKNARWDCAEKIRKALKILESKPEPNTELRAENDKLKKLLKECISHLIDGGYFTIKELEQALKGELWHE